MSTLKPALALFLVAIAAISLAAWHNTAEAAVQPADHPAARNQQPHKTRTKCSTTIW